MQHIIPTKVPYIPFKMYYIFQYYISVSSNLLQRKTQAIARSSLFSHNGLCFFSFYASSLSKRFFMLLVLIHRVDVLCSRAEVVGGIMPATPRTISPVLMPTIMR